MTAPSILVVFHTSEGQTAKIAERVAETLRADGAVVEVADTESVGDVDGYDAVVLGDSIHLGHHSPELVAFARANAEALVATHTALFQVCLTSANPDEQHTAVAQRLVQELLDETGLDPEVIGMFAGAVLYTQYGWLKRRVLREIVRREGGDTDTSRDHEYTDWDAVAAFAHDVGRLAGG